ncbi:MAG TPA: DUF192 domain-containing protein [Thermoanaerobaculia bacterium]|nr:DUF192 domain-containing protein [Thermoanaerobaculia bacterium]HUM30543.1 DUF192 domain-containing protein [Thermoanaerobaculia bacterium]HXK68735.1 DUF192 domain-containing protein [Thermoanaerobaculia bacterium]
MIFDSGLAVLMIWTALSIPAQGEPSGPHVILPSGHILTVELAITDEERSYGLMFRESLAPDTGMLFLFNHCEPHSFWMKNCFFPLDLLWLDRDGTILAIEENLLPCRHEPCELYEPQVPACMVLEIDGGKAQDWKLKPGNKITIKGVPREKTYGP